MSNKTLSLMLHMRKQVLAAQTERGAGGKEEDEGKARGGDRDGDAAGLSDYMKGGGNDANDADADYSGGVGGGRGDAQGPTTSLEKGATSRNVVSVSALQASLILSLQDEKRPPIPIWCLSRTPNAQKCVRCPGYVTGTDHYVRCLKNRRCFKLFLLLRCDRRPRYLFVFTRKKPEAS